MRFQEIINESFLLCEDKKEYVLKAQGNKLLSASGKELTKFNSAEEVVDQLIKADPTKNHSYLQWLANRYLANDFRLEDAARIRTALKLFTQYKPRLEKKDINSYTLHQLEDVTDKLENPEVGMDSEQQVDVSEIEVLYKGPLGFLAIPNTEEASCQLGSGTKWCTAAREDNAFEDYNESGPLYIWKDKTGEKYQFHFGEMQFMDARDRPIEHKQLMFFRKEHPVLKKLFAKEEKEIIKDDIYGAYEYARDVIEGRWPEAEPYIMKKSKYAYEYAKVIIGSRWREAEPYIMKNTLSAYLYASDVIKGRWPEAEPVIMKDPYYAFEYAKDVIKGRWREAEPYIMTNTYEAFRYAKYVIKGRWPEAEPVFMKDPQYALIYARDVIGGRWSEAEPVIKKDNVKWGLYKTHFNI